MNKARITYRFDGQGKPERARRQQPENEPKHIPQHIPHDIPDDIPHQASRRTQQRDPQLISQQDPKIIPLYQEEFRVVRESVSEPGGIESHRSKAPILNEFTTDFGAYRSPFEDETDRVESIIRTSQRVDGETGYVEVEGRQDHGTMPVANVPHVADAYDAGHNEQYREPFANGFEGYRQDAKDGSYNWGDPQSGGARYVRTASSPPWTRIVLSVTAAVATGVLFGFLVLSMFTDKGLPFQPFGNGKQHVTAQSGTANAGAGAVGDGKAGSGNAAADQGSTDKAAASSLAGASLIPVNLSAHSYSFLQNGIFSTAAAADTAVSDLKKKGYAAASEPGDKSTVYAGFALQKEDAAQLGSKLKDDKIDVYVKTLTVPAAPKLKWVGKANAGELSSYFQQGDKLVQMIGSLTVLHLGETDPTAIEPASLEAIKSTHQAWLSGSTQVKAGASADTAAALDKMSTSINTAVQLMDEYRKNPSTAYLWQAQSALMQYVLAEKGLFTELSAQ